MEIPGNSLSGANSTVFFFHSAYCQHKYLYIYLFIFLIEHRLSSVSSPTKMAQHEPWLIYFYDECAFLRSRFFFFFFGGPANNILHVCIQNIIFAEIVSLKRQVLLLCTYFICPSSSARDFLPPSIRVVRV